MPPARHSASANAAPPPEPAAARPGPFQRLWRAPALLLALAVLFWSGNFVVGRAVHEAVPPVALAFWRWTGGLVLVLAFAGAHLRRDLPMLRQRWKTVLVLAVFGIAAYNTLVYLGLRSTTAINALLMQSAMPLVILLFSFLLFGERARPMQLLGVVASLAGVAVIAGRGSPSALFDLSLNVGDAWVMAAVVSYALYSAMLQKRPTVHPLSFLAATFAVGAATLLPIYVWESATIAPLRPSVTAFLAIGYVALFPSFLAYLCFNRGVELIGANRAGQFVHLMPVFGSILAIAFLGEAFHAFHAVGIGLIAAGILLATFGSRAGHSRG